METSPWGGSEELWGRAAEELLRRGHTVSACVRSWPNQPERVGKLAAMGVQIFSRGGNFGIGERLKKKLVGGNGMSLGETKVFQWMQATRPDLVCINNGGCTDGLNWMELCVKAGLPFANICQANAEWVWPSDKDAERISKAFHAAKSNYFVSRANLELFQDQIAEFLTNAHVVRNPFNVVYDPSLSWPDMTGGVKLACVGRLDPAGKGQDLILHVLARPEWRSRNMQVAFFGGGVCEQGVRRLASRLDLGSVEFRGHVSHVEEIWREHHALILASRCEGLPLAAVEAMFCSRMAIVTDVAGNKELIDDGINGFVAAAPKLELLAETLERAWANKDRWEAMGKAAREKVVQMVPKDPVSVFCDALLKHAG